MTTVLDVPSALGEYMLKGWVLTDIVCKKCSKIPLLRSPTARDTFFCAACDGSPSTQVSVSSALSLSASSSVDSSSHAASRPSTPPTEVSSTLSSPTFAPPVDMAEIIRRRQQSDFASAEIGKRLLQGWAMLADECLNTDCYGIPLVRPPKQNGELSPKKECVVCHATYIDRPNGNGLQRLTSDQAQSTSRLAGDPLRIDRAASSLPSFPTASVVETPMAIGNTLPAASNPNDTVNSHSTLRSFNPTVDALERSLHTLTERLKHLSNSYTADPTQIGQTADAISKVSRALMRVHELQASERKATTS